MSAALALALLLSLPESEQYTRRSLPQAIAKSLTPQAGRADGIFRVRRFHDDQSTLWVVTLPCAGTGRLSSDEPGLNGGPPCKVGLFLEAAAGALREVGSATGELVDVEGVGALPAVLYFHVRGAATETRLRWTEVRPGQRYEAKTVAHLFRDPLSQERVGAGALKETAFADLKAGHYAAAAGRYSLLCDDPCAVLDVEAMATAFLGARLFPQGEVALRRAIGMPGHQGRDWESLASLLRAEGRNAEASEVEGKFGREGVDGGR